MITPSIVIVFSFYSAIYINNSNNIVKAVFYIIVCCIIVYKSNYTIDAVEILNSACRTSFGKNLCSVEGVCNVIFACSNTLCVIGENITVKAIELTEFAPIEGMTAVGRRIAKNVISDSLAAEAYKLIFPN